jgi:hypothetical protein
VDKEEPLLPPHVDEALFRVPEGVSIRIAVKTVETVVSFKVIAGLPVPSLTPWEYRQARGKA